MERLRMPDTVQVNWRNVYPQAIAAAVAFLCVINPGVNLAYSNLLLNSLSQDNISWIASIVAVSTCIGAITSGPVADIIGRRKLIILLSIFCVVSWLFMAFSSIDELYLLYVGRVLSGISGGLSTVVIVYVSEISDKSYRPMFLSLLTIYFSFGILLTSALNVYLNWNQTALFFVIFFTITTTLSAYILPESPTWILHFRPHDTVQAKQVFRELNTQDEIFEQEWSLLRENNNVTRTIGLVNFRSLRKEKLYQSLFVSFILISLQQLSGAYTVIFYAYRIAPLIGNEVGEKFKNESFVIFGFTRFIISIIAGMLSLKTPRRQLLIASSLGMAISSFVIAISCCDNDALSFYSYRYISNYIAIAAFVSFVAFSSVGVHGIPWTIPSEILPSSVAAIGASLLTAWAYLLMFFITKIYPFFINDFGIIGSFILFGCISLIFSFFTYFYVPETLGKYNDEIRNFLGQHVRFPCVGKK